MRPGSGDVLAEHAPIEREAVVERLERVGRTAGEAARPELAARVLSHRIAWTRGSGGATR